jgi:hypothetical protein
LTKTRKEWIEDRANEISWDVYEVDFSELPEDTQAEVMALAQEKYDENYSSIMDREYDLYREREVLDLQDD